MKLKLLACLIIFTPLVSTTMEKPLGIENPAIQSENAYAKALFTGDIAKVKSFLQGGAHADYFVKVERAKAGAQAAGRPGEMIQYAEMTPLEFVLNYSDAPQNRKFAIAELLLQSGADRDFLSSQLSQAIGLQDFELIKWLISHGARDESALAEAKAQLDVASPEEKASWQEIIQLLSK